MVRIKSRAWLDNFLNVVSKSKCGPWVHSRCLIIIHSMFIEVKNRNLELELCEHSRNVFDESSLYGSCVLILKIVDVLLVLANYYIIICTCPSQISIISLKGKLWADESLIPVIAIRFLCPIESPILLLLIVFKDLKLHIIDIDFNTQYYIAFHNLITGGKLNILDTIGPCRAQHS